MNLSLLLSLGLLSSLFVAAVATAETVAARSGVAYASVEASFSLPDLTGNPFDYRENDVRVAFATPDGAEVSVPAFYDGETTWRVRYTPDQPGHHTIRRIVLNGEEAPPQRLDQREFDVTGAPGAGFVRIDPEDAMRFVLGDGSPYYPVGYNLGWRSNGLPPLAESIAKMGGAGVNWTRIWMCHWDNKNLEWNNGGEQPPVGTLKLDTARLWDEIVAAADRYNVRFQLVLQHHGQYSTRVNPNWEHHPWNRANGGWLDSPVQFFTDERAKALTKIKYRYILARWGHSPAIMAWELFNEVEYTDAFEQDLPAVVAWHREMAEFIREHDLYGHLITTSSRVTEASLWPAMDYYQAHIYPPDVITAVASLDAREFDRAYFYGEIGSSTQSWREEKGRTLHHALWSSLASRSSGAAQYWYWDNVEPNDLLFHYTSAQRFIERAGVLAQRDLERIDAAVETPTRGPLRFGPGLSWAKSETIEFDVRPDGTVEGLAGMSAFLQGQNNRAMFPHATFKVNYPADGTFAVRFDQASKNGARLELSIDGQVVETLDVPPSTTPGRDGQIRDTALDRAVEISVSAGEHTIRLENTGQDWLTIRDITLTPYAPRLAVLGKGNDDLRVLWVYRRDGGEGEPVAGSLRIPNTEAGAYRVVWWDTLKGEAMDEASAAVSEDGVLTLQTPPITQDAAAWITPVE